MKRMAALLVLAAALLVPVLAQAADAKAAAAQWVAYGNKQYAAKQFDAAIQSFNSALKFDKTNAGAYQGIAYCYWGKGDKVNYGKYMQYAKYYQGQAGGGTAAAGGGAAAFLAQGNKYMQAKQYPYAAWAYNKATQAEPNNAQAWQALGTAYYYQGNKANAAQAWKKSLELNPNNPTLQQYANSLAGQAGGGTAAEGGEGESASWVPYVMGAVVVTLGAIMIFLF